MTDTFPAPEAMPIDLDVEAALDASREARAEALLEFARIPSVSCLPEHAGDMRSAAEWIANRLRNLGATEVEVVDTAVHPIVFGEDPRGRGRARPPSSTATTTSSRSTHRAVGDGPVGAVRARRPGRGARRGGRQGPARDAPPAARRICATRTLPVNLTFVFEGEEESRRRVWTAGSTRTRPGSRPTSRSSATRDSSRATCRRSPSACAGSCTRRSTWGVAGRLHSGMYGGTVRTRPTPWRHRRRAQGPRRADPDPGFYDDVVPSRRASARRWPRCRSTRRRTARPSPVPRSSARPGSRSLEHKGSRPTLDVNGMWSGFRRGGEDDHPGPRPREAVVPARRAPGPGEDLRGAPAVRRRDRPARRHGDHDVPPRRRPEPHPHRPPGDPGRGAGDQRRSASRPCTSARAARSRSPRRSATSSGCRSCCSGSRQPACNAHAPNEWLDLDNFERGTRVIVRLWDELDRASRRAPRAWQPVADGDAAAESSRTAPGGTIGSLAARIAVLGCATGPMTGAATDRSLAEDGRT